MSAGWGGAWDLMDLFDQTEIWVGKGGVEHQINTMPWTHLCAVQKHIENSATYYRYRIGNAVVASLAGAGEQAAWDVKSALDEDEALPDDEWLAGQALYVRISELLGDRRFESAGAVA